MNSYQRGPAQGGVPKSQMGAAVSLAANCHRAEPLICL
jgi:hypothetical protein